VTADLFAAYDATGTAWQQGPGRLYDQLAAVVVDRCPALDNRSLVLDLGAGTGAATRAIRLPHEEPCHPDLEADDPEAEVARLVALGASHVDVGQTGDEGFVVLIDPEGNEFCVLVPATRARL
jgi:hypothetical protein